MKHKELLENLGFFLGSPLQFSVSPTFFFKKGRGLTAMRTKQPNDQQDSLTAVFEALSLHPLPDPCAARRCPAQLDK